ncbi:MAG: InlB B-repeat-containing protein, partial [Treponema sp.]|nr:InlB B-repeat-containing protein [Treponema sp.]
MKAKLLAALLGAVLCAGLWTGCRDLFHTIPREEWTVTFNLDGGNINGIGNAPTRTVKNDASIGSANMPSNPNKSGYTFGDWYTSRNGGGRRFTSSTRVSADITVYAKWTVATVQRTVTFDLDGGNVNGVTSSRIRLVNSGASIGSANMPPEPTRSGYAFGGWYTSRNGAGTQFTFSTRVNANMTVYAKWVEIKQIPGGLSLAESLAWISANTIEGGDYSYSITIGADESLAPQTLSYSGKNVNITLDGGTMERTVSLSSSGSLFTMGNGATLTIGNNVTLQGRSSNNAPLVRVNNGGTLTMGSGSKIRGNTISSGYGGGVYVNSSGTFTMSGGTISGNSASNGGGVYVYSSGTFTMSGGTISGNTGSRGGGVYVYSGTFTKQPGGTIYGSNVADGLKNTATSGYEYGNAVYVSSSKKRDTTAGAGVTLDSAKDGAAGGWETPLPIQISLQPVPDDPPLDSTSTIAYSSVSGGAWTLQGDGRRKSPSIGDYDTTKSRISFTSTTANASITIQLDVSSESGYDYAFISQLDNASATYDSGYYTGSRISGEDSVTITIPVPTAGDHFIDIGYR